MTTDEAIRVAAKLGIDADDLDRVRALLDLLDPKPRSASASSAIPKAKRSPASATPRAAKIFR